MKQRIQYFDIARGIAILCVILGHSVLIAQFFIPQNMLGNVFLYHFCFSFHMPIFFILSGFFMHPEREFRWKKESKELLATYVITALAVTVAASALAYIRHVGGLGALLGWLEAGFYGSGDFSPHQLWQVPFRIGALWFLLGLFWAHLIVHVVSKSRFAIVWILLCFGVGYYSSKFIWLPLSIQAGMTSAAYVYVGVLCRRYNVLDFVRRYPWIWGILGLVWALSIWRFSGFSMAMNDYGSNFILTVLGSLAGSLCVIGISMLIDCYLQAPARFLAKVGEISLALLCVHLFEDDVTPWSDIFHNLSVPSMLNPWLWALVFVIRLVVDGLLLVGLSYIPKVNRIFFPSLAKSQRKTTD